MRAFNRSLVVLAIAAALIPSHTFAYKEIRCYVPQAPELRLSGVKRIAVLDLRSKNANWKWNDQALAGKEIATKITELLLRDRRGVVEVKPGFAKKGFPAITFYPAVSTRVFDVIERGRLDQILTEQGRQQSGHIDEVQAVEIGKVAAVDAIVIGEVSSDPSSTKTLVPSGNAYIQCTERTLAMEASIRVLDVKTGTIFGMKTATSKLYDKYCAGDRGPMVTEAEIVRQAAAAVAEQLVSYFAPTYVPIESELQKVSDKEIQKSCDEAAEAAEKGDMRRAASLYKTAQSTDPYNPKVLFNLGLVHEAAGAVTEAVAYYENSLSLKEDKDCRSALERAKLAQSTHDYYTSLDQPVPAVSFESDAEGREGWVTVAGKPKDRVGILASPSTGGEVVAQVPGGVRLQLLAREGDWCKVKLIDGKEGYITVADTK